MAPGPVIQYDFNAMMDMALDIYVLGDSILATDRTMLDVAKFMEATGVLKPAGEKYLQQHHQNAKALAQVCHDLNSDLKKSITAMRNGDAQGKTKFY